MEPFENPVELRTAISTPHFDDRRVVQRAQRVVPLNEIRTKLRLRRWGFLGGAFAIAIMLGAASALLAVRIKRGAANPSIIAVSTIEEPVDEPVSEATAEAQVLPVGGETIADSAPVDEETVEEPVKPVAPKHQERLAQRPRVVDRGRDEVQPSEDEELEQIREAVLYEQWQERRARRAARRERRNRIGDRDLSHLDEIFEGRRRSERP